MLVDPDANEFELCPEKSPVGRGTRPYAERPCRRLPGVRTSPSPVPSRDQDGISWVPAGDDVFDQPPLACRLQQDRLATKGRQSCRLDLADALSRYTEDPPNLVQRHGVATAQTVPQRQDPRRSWCEELRDQGDEFTVTQRRQQVLYVVGDVRTLKNAGYIVKAWNR